MLREIKVLLKKVWRWFVYGPLHWKDSYSPYSSLTPDYSVLLTRDGIKVGRWEYGVGFSKEYPVSDGDFILDKMTHEELQREIDRENLL